MKKDVTRQYFYLVMMEDSNFKGYPIKITLQEHDAIKWGKKKLTERRMLGDANYTFALYRQLIAHNGELERIGELKPYPYKVLTEEEKLKYIEKVAKKRKITASSVIAKCYAKLASKNKSI